MHFNIMKIINKAKQGSVLIQPFVCMFYGLCYGSYCPTHTNEMYYEIWE